MLKIRLMRIGTKKRPFYRVVVVDERAKRTGGYIELLGTYNPLTEPKDIKLKQDRIDYWVKQGAQMSYGFLRIIGKAPQRKPRKPRKEKVSKEENVSKVSEEEEVNKQESDTPKEPVESKIEETAEGTAEQPPAEEVKIKKEEKKAEEASAEQPQTESPSEPTTEESNFVIPSASEESPDLKSTDSSASPQNDNVEKGEKKKDERSA